MGGGARNANEIQEENAMSLHRVWQCSLVLATVALPAVAAAQGFGLNEISSCAISRGYAVTGAPCNDASVIYWNPAAATGLTGNSLLFGATSIGVKGIFTRDSSLGRFKSTEPTAYPPSVFFTHTGSDGMSWGFAAYVPYGLTSQWGSDFPGRFMAQKASISTFYFQPNFAWKVTDNWSIGGGPVVGHSSVELVRALDLSTLPAQPGVLFGQLGIPARTEFGQATIKGSGTAYGFELGVSGKLGDNVTVGARYLSALHFAYNNATANFVQVPTGLTLTAGNPLSAPTGTPVDALVASSFSGSGPFVSQSASTAIAHPDQAEVGFGYTGFRRWLLSADYAWVGWKKDKELDIAFSNPGIGTTTEVTDYNNSSSLRLGAQYTAVNNWQWRVGFSAVAAAAPDEAVTPLLPDQDRANYTGGVGIPLMGGWTLDAGYAYVWTPGRRGRIDPRSVRTTTATQINTGIYNLSANIITLGLKATF
jgi:long-chain fatty acid transport protein